jgi:hypothetical protein
MVGWKRGAILRACVAVVGVVAAIWFALWYFIPAPPSTITMVVGPAYGRFAQHYQERLAKHHVNLVIRSAHSSVDSTSLLRDPKSNLDAGFTLGVIDSAELPGFVSLGRITYSPIWFFYRGPETLDHLTQFKGKRVSVGPASGRISNQILATYGVNAENTTIVALEAPLGAQALRSGEVDVMSIAQEVNNPNIQSLLRDPAIRVMNLAQAEALTKLFPSLDRVVLPQGVIDPEKNIPSSDINLVALTSLVVARANLHPETIYLLAQTMKEEHSHRGIFHRAGEFPTQTDPDFPMAEEALDYYRNGPSFLQRYLPFWMISYAKRIAAILVATVAVVIPLFNYTPKLYAWFLELRLGRLYRLIRLVNSRLKSELTADQLIALQNDLENIDRAANILPMRHSELFLNLLMHIRSSRSELATRLSALRG